MDEYWERSTVEYFKGRIRYCVDGRYYSEAELIDEFHPWIVSQIKLRCGVSTQNFYDFEEEEGNNYFQQDDPSPYRKSSVSGNPSRPTGRSSRPTSHGSRPSGSASRPFGSNRGSLVATPSFYEGDDYDQDYYVPVDYREPYLQKYQDSQQFQNLDGFEDKMDYDVHGDQDQQFDVCEDQYDYGQPPLRKNMKHPLTSMEGLQSYEEEYGSPPFYQEYDQHPRYDDDCPFIDDGEKDQIYYDESFFEPQQQEATGRSQEEKSVQEELSLSRAMTLMMNIMIEGFAKQEKSSEELNAHLKMLTTQISQSLNEFVSNPFSNVQRETAFEEPIRPTVSFNRPNEDVSQQNEDNVSRSSDPTSEHERLDVEHGKESEELIENHPCKLPMELLGDDSYHLEDELKYESFVLVEGDAEEMVDQRKGIFVEEKSNLNICFAGDASYSWKRRRKRRKRSPRKHRCHPQPSQKFARKFKKRLGEIRIEEMDRIYKEIYKDDELINTVLAKTLN